MNIIDFYKSILDCGNLATDKDGYTSVKVTGSPVLVTGKRLVLPTNSQLTAGNWSEKIVFHPLSENILRGESDVIAKLRSVFNIRLNYTFAAIAQNLFSIVASSAEHHLLSPEQSEMLSAISEVDSNTLELFNKITAAALKDSYDKAFISIFLKRGGVINGKKHSRVGIVTFPLYEELKNVDQEVFHGIKLRVKDKLAIKQLYEYIFPNLETAETYNFGSDSSIAPFFHALMGTVLGIGSKFNDILELFSKEIDDSKELIFASDWVDTIENLGEMMPQIRLIPMQAGNEGSLKVGETQSGVPQVAPVAQPAPLSYQPPVAPQQPLYAPHVAGPVNQQMPWQHQQMPQQAPVQQGIVMTDGGLDFNSIVRARPQLAATTMNVGQPQQFQTMMNQAPNPRWNNPMPYGNPQPQYNQQFPQNNFSQPQPVYQNPGYGQTFV